jgi:hypothetical protein
MIEPMLGFDWRRGSYAFASGPAVFRGARTVISGGIREYRSAAHVASETRFLRDGAMPGVDSTLACVGRTAPRPDWAAYALGSPTPLACADGGSSGGALSSLAFPVSAYASGFAQPRSWRGELNWEHLFSAALSATAGGSYALNSRLPAAYDMNFRAQPRMFLGSEGGRPVFVTPAGIDPTTGTVSTAESRIVPSFTHVTELRSTLSGWRRQLRVGATYRIGTSNFVSPAVPSASRLNASLAVSYVNSVGRSESNGFSGTTGGSPLDLDHVTLGTPEHVVQASVSARLEGWFTIAGALRVSSGFRYTPMVSGDINGDGLANDRAYVPVPGVSAGVQGDMQSLLASMPGAARKCLERQAGSIAHENSCVGPWSVVIPAIAMSMEPCRIGLGNRGTLNLLLTNPLGGLDQVLHGSGHLHGWGQVAIPDRTLLMPRGFDASQNRFAYDVNPSFGSVKTSAAAYRMPSTLTVDVTWDVSPDRETQSLKGYARAASDGQSVTPASLKQELLRSADMSRPNLVQLTHFPDSLRLSPSQVQAIARLNKRLLDVRDSIYSELASFLAANRDDLGSTSVRDHWHTAISASLRQTYTLVPELQAILTPAQFAWAAGQGWLSELEITPSGLERLLRQPQVVPR